MKLKNIFLGVAAAAMAMAAASCSNIDEGDRLIYVKPAEVGRAVLIEDLTGQRCINCPTGTDIIKGIIKTYGEDNVIAVGIHCGPLGFAGTSKRVGLKTDTGDEYFTHWANGTELYQPSAIFNRKKGPSDNYNNWPAEVSLIISEKANLYVNIDNAYDAKTRTLTTKVEAFGVNDTVTVSGKLQVWIVEDGIKAMQLMPDGSANQEYVHNHVFRAAVNGTWGEEVTVKEGETTSKDYSYVLPETWNAENISVVAFVYNDNGVENVAKKHIVEHEEETEK
ncbi:Omp28 family outer membrane lipoprotein [uncultured Prevotella sp.]|uniref:Omp28 family outer membrane lipoprotein n=1 Tax=uncultured Prevotella sp. TaxID=159272 RepID=UPI0025F615DD|nr:Omp28 family outer membrane lipoprotein [uncultured Prevotella sp.]